MLYTNLQMLKNIIECYKYISRSNHSSVALEPKHRKFRSEHSKLNTPIQTNRNKKPNPTVGSSTKYNTFKALTYFL